MMKQLLPLVAALVLTSPSYAKELETETSVKAESLPKYFTGYDGAFVFVDLESGRTIRYNKKRCAEQISPCSTFKIFNSLAGLDSGVLTGADHKMKWDGKRRPMDNWNKDQTLQSAVTDSVVWYFQNVARDVGMPRMQKYIDDVDYGNRDLSGGLTTFWLDSSLKISADEQVEFLKKLYFDKLPFSTSSQDTVKTLIKLKETPDTVFAGKTGTDAKDGKRVLGWFVGYVVHDGHPYVFATNIKSKDNAWGRRARDITERILVDAKLLESTPPAK